MVVKVLGATLRGLEAVGIAVEVVLRGTLDRGFTFVGLPTAGIRESKERVLGALRSADLPQPRLGVVVNLAPADVRKEGLTLDLAIALAVLGAQEVVPAARLGRYLVAGELALTGRVRPVRGSLALGLLASRRSDIDGIVLPMENATEVRRFVQVPVIPVASLADAVAFFADGVIPEYTAAFAAPEDAAASTRPAAGKPPDLSEVRGQETAKRALVLAAAGGHSLLMKGPPGTGKTLLARRLVGILPPLPDALALETALIHSVTGRSRGDRVQMPPIRAPHHTVSHAGLVGGGNPPRPGEVSLAHNGVLFLDELPEFSRGALEALRECLEEGAVAVVRAGASVRFPARFQLVAAMNPCPCGYASHPQRACRCAAGEVIRYRRRLSGALVDRIDLEVEVGPVDPAVLDEGLGGLDSAAAAAGVRAARDRQASRAEAGVPCLNAALGPSETAALPGLEADARGILRVAARKLGLSARAYHRTLRVARTIADVDGVDCVNAGHVAEALRYRPREEGRG